MSELLCQQCKEAGEEVEAFGFCLDCCDCLCEDCYKCHRKPRQMRNHILLNKEQMLKDKDALPSNDSANDTCQEHSETIKYFCPDHDSLGCSVCVTIEHKTCEDIVHIPQASGGIADSEEYKVLEHEISETTTRFEKLIPAATNNISKSEASSTKIAEEISAHMEVITATIKKLEEAVRNNAGRCHNEDVQRMETIISKSKEALEKLKHMKTSMNNLDRMKQNNKLFIAIKSNFKELRIMQDELTESENKNNVRVSHFDANSGLTKFLCAMDCLGEIHHTLEGPEDGVESPNTVDTEPVENIWSAINLQNMTTTHLKDVYITPKADKSLFSIYCNLSAIEALAQDKVVFVCDAAENTVNARLGFSNVISRVALLDIKHNRINSELVIPGRCRDIVKINDSHVVLGLGDSGNTLLKTHPTITVIRRLGSSTGGYLSLFNNEIFISIGSNIISKVDVSGRESVFMESKPVLKERQNFLASVVYESNNQRKVYSIVAHSKQYSHSESWLSPDCKNRYLAHGVIDSRLTEKIELPKPPESIHMSDNGKLLFVLADDVIYVVRTGTTDAAVLVGEEEKLSRVSAIAFCSKSRQLIVGMHECNYIKVYHVSGTW